jgi:hypothetical protein
MVRRLVFIAWLAASLVGCGKEKPPEAPPTFLSQKGTVMPLRSALSEISFKPFIPSHRIVETALIAPYNGGDDNRKNRGIAFEYVSGHESYVIQEWPGNGRGGPISLPPEGKCALSAYHLGRRPPPPPEEGQTPAPTLPPQTQEGVLWSARGIVFNLLPSGNAQPPATIAEARRLIRVGACR